MEKIRILKCFCFTLFIMFLTIFFTLSYSFAFFDTMSFQDENRIEIGGNWKKKNLGNDIIDYVTNHYNSDKEKILELLGELTEDGISFNDIFKDYSQEELKTTVDEIHKFNQSFLTKDANGEYKYVQSQINSPIPVLADKKLMPGQSTQIYKVMETANYSRIAWYTPITLSITLEAQNGEDISDFALEILLDSTAFSENSPFEYKYVLYDRTAYTSNLIENTEGNATNNKLIFVGNGTTFETLVKRKLGVNSYRNDVFLHNIQKPITTGAWGRMATGPNAFIGQETNSNIGMQQILQPQTNTKRNGMILLGKPNGTKTEIRITFYKRNPRISNHLPIFPILLNLSRGLRIDENNSPYNNQFTSEVMPIITMNAVYSEPWY